ncbi:nucleocapsid [Rift Valley fever virus]|uniref:Nucleoprotein n=6 Tax=Phlebovirus riftense TaxID=3052676 RepID=A2SZY9_RVFVZ
MDNYQELAIQFAAQAVDRNEIEQWVREFAYQGFDARRVIELLKQYGGADWEKDAKKMIVLALTRGNKPRRMMMKMSKEGKATVEALINKYKLKEGNPSRDELTLSRVAAALAGWTCQALVVLSEWLPVTGTTMDGLSPAYPRHMMHPSFAGMVDPSLPGDYLRAILDAHSLYLLQFSRVINPNLRGRTKEEVAATFTQPMNAAVNSNFISHEKRREFLKAFGLVDSNGKPSAAVMAAAQAYKTAA